TVAILSAYHNRADAVDSTLRSIANQTYEDFEAIIWDDASTDSTWSRLQSEVRELGDRRFTIYRHESNRGLAQGLNEALARTRAKYVAIVGSGDWCDPERIRLQVEAL